MSNAAIKVENPGEKYQIKYEQKESYQTFQDMILNGSKNIIRSLNLFDLFDLCVVGIIHFRKTEKVFADVI